MQKEYQVLYKRMWVTVSRAQVVGKSLHYKLYDSMEGVAKPGEWKVAGEAFKEIVTALHNDKPSNDKDRAPQLFGMPYGTGTKKLQAYTEQASLPVQPDYDTRYKEGYDPADDNILDI